MALWTQWMPHLILAMRITQFQLMWRELVKHANAKAGKR